MAEHADQNSRCQDRDIATNGRAYAKKTLFGLSQREFAFSSANFPALPDIGDPNQANLPEYYLRELASL
ncbi:hypothetical protein [Anaeroselena agilis]|uniref:Uncharacterized protein n=1 Tax=Anaeroselena agilis TaxID=3063788 RepID=A0ABU3NUD1_9FIRM|nr:hypothetical protein [Selenomonadales bacterium 4137-cl]